MDKLEQAIARYEKYYKEPAKEENEMSEEAYMGATRVTEIDAEFFGQEGVEMMQQAAANGIEEACAEDPEMEAGA